MSHPDKNNPDGLGSYGKSPSRFVERPKDQERRQPNDATEAPMGHSAVDQEVFDEAQEELGRKPTSPPKPPQAGQPGRGGRMKASPRLPDPPEGSGKGGKT